MRPVPRYPRVIAMFPGIAVYVRDEAHHRELRRGDLISVCIYLGALIAVGAWLAWEVLS